MTFLYSTLIALSSFHAVQASSVSTVQIEPESRVEIKSESVNYRFKLLDTQKRRYLKEADLSVTHEKVLHFVVYDQALEEFQHVHPTFDGQFWSVPLAFAASGNYKLWAQGKVKKGEEFSASTSAVVAISKSAWPTPPRLADLREGTDGISRITLSNAKLKAGQMAMLDLVFSRTDGTPSKITPYLGAVAHVIAVTADGQELVHVHPMDHGGKNKAMLHATFPAAGSYRVWVEFVDDGTLKRVPLALKVEE